MKTLTAHSLQIDKGASSPLSTSMMFKSWLAPVGTSSGNTTTDSWPWVVLKIGIRRAFMVAIPENEGRSAIKTTYKTPLSHLTEYGHTHTATVTRDFSILADR